ncbi:MAG: cyclic nucleotide-binding domain-containing protein [Pseudanabaenaceae cyanobacterium]
MDQLPPLTRTKVELMATLAKIPYFESLPEKDLLFLVRQGYPQLVPQFQYVCREGDTANSFYVVLAGKVEVISLKKKKHISILYPGDFFGEIALFTGSPRVATCRTIEDSKFFVIHREYLKAILAAHPEVAERIARTILDRQDTLISLGVLSLAETEEWDIDIQYIRQLLQPALKT